MGRPAVRALLRPPGRELGFEYELRRSDRARNLRITVGEDGVVVVLPRRASARQAHAFVAERRDWILRSLAKIAADRRVVAARVLADGCELPLLDARLRLRLFASTGDARVTWSRAADELRVRSGDHSREAVAGLLERWYRRRAREEAVARLDAAAARNGTTYARVAIRDQRTRWGSCSSAGTISINWRLLLAPEHVFDYVIEHEAAHLEVRDHSHRFWALIDERVPGWHDSRDWLRENGGTLKLA